MNASQIKALSWLTAAGLTAGLSYYVWDFVSTLSERQQPLDNAAVRGKLQPTETKSTRTDEIVSYEDVKRGFQQFNWTGMPPAPPPVPVDSVNVPKTPTSTPVSDLVSIQMIKEDTRNPAGSSVYIKYKAASGVIDSKPADEHLSIGDRLLTPHQYVKLVRISVSEGVAFAFDDEGRAEEVLSPREFDPNTEIVKVGPGGVRIPQRQSSIPPVGADAKRWNPKKTVQVRPNEFIIGDEDSLHIAENFSKILANDVRHKRHIDPKTGKYDGIELKSVKAGSVAERHGAQAGDIIKSINGHPVTSLNEAVTYAKNNSEKYSTWIIEVENKGKTRTVTYETPSD